MAKRKKKNKNKDHKKDEGKFVLPSGMRRWTWGVVFLICALIITFAFFDASGVAGLALRKLFDYLVGKTILLMPLILVLTSLVFFRSRYKKFTFPLFLAFALLIIGVSGVLGGLGVNDTDNIQDKNTSPVLLGGWIGYLLSSLMVKLFGFWISQIIFIIIILIGMMIFWHLLKRPSVQLPNQPGLEVEQKPTFIKKIFAPKLSLKEIPSDEPEVQKKEVVLRPIVDTVGKTGGPQLQDFLSYQAPPLDLLDVDKNGPLGVAATGDTRNNSAIIKKTLQNFDIPVEMSEVNIGPTVTQYTLKPAEGIKLSRITALSNDLSLSLAAHPIRIEAPIPGRALVGIEIPNKVRAQVRLRNLFSGPDFQLGTPGLTLALGRDVAGNPTFTDLARMPHMLVAGSTGSGKTIFLNALLLNLLYKNSPATLRLILVDPKRVEFPVYSNLPHLLCPVIYNAHLTNNALRWLVGEMERRFDVLVEAGARDITGYNNIITKKLNASKEQKDSDGSSPEPMPYIVLIIDELADLMAAKGREIESGIVRIAQMARAVGIHLVLATQRPSVEVITGLIKANITARVAFQVASQVDSRTVLDTSGAEKLLGAGDMLYISGEIAKPKRIQCAYVTEKELRRVVEHIKSQSPALTISGDNVLAEDSLSENLGKALQGAENNSEGGSESDDVLFEEAKRLVIEAKKASASLLQRRLRIGYARAARLIDILEDKGIVGPAEGARPREIYFRNEENVLEDNNENDSGWQKV